MDAISSMTSQVSPADLAEQYKIKTEFNSQIASQNKGKIPGQELGKDDFLKILITQLQNQDPSKPLEDKEFIAQMAQFTSLEQMTNISANFNKVSGLVASGQAQNMLGRNVEIEEFGLKINGIVSEVICGDYPQVMVNNKLYDSTLVTKLIN